MSLDVKLREHRIRFQEFPIVFEFAMNVSELRVRVSILLVIPERKHNVFGGGDIGFQDLYNRLNPWKFFVRGNSSFLDG